MEEDRIAEAATMRRISEEARQAARTLQCPLCGDDTCELEGIYCPDQTHFVCNNCFTDHVTVQCTPADEFVPYAAGEVWCTYKPIAGDAGCPSQRPFTLQVQIRDRVSVQYHSNCILLSLLCSVSMEHYKRHSNR